MKFFLFAALVSGLGFSAQSQVVNKGDKLFGGSFSIYFYNLNNQGPSSYYSSSNIGITPSFAWAIKKDLTLGIKGGISYSGNRIRQSAGIQKNTFFNIVPAVFLKKYKALKNQFGVYFNNEINGIYSSEKGGISPDFSKTYNWGVGYSFSPGVFYKFSESFLGEANIGAAYVSYYNRPGNFGIGASFLQSFNVGVNYIIGKKG
jgi:hypothetical protein